MMRSVWVAVLVLAASLCAAPPPSPNEGQAILQIQDSIAMDDLARAQVLLQEALSRWPRSARLINLQGILHATHNQTPEATNDFQRAVELNPRLAPAWRNLAKLYMAEPGAENQAASALEHALRIDPRDSVTQLDLARVLEWQGLFEKSLRFVNQISSRNAKSAEMSALRCADLAGLQRGSEASAACAILAAEPDLSESDVLAILPVLEQQLPSAALILEEALQARHLDTELSRAHLGTIYERTNHLVEARQMFESSARANPHEAGPLLDLARVAYKQKDIEGALGYVAHARDLAPSNAAVHFFFGMLAVEKNLPLEAKKSLGTAVRLAPDNPSYNYVMGAVSLQGPDAAEAIPYFKRYVELSGGDPRGHFALGVAQFQCSNYSAAHQELDPLASVRDTAAGAHYFLGKMAKLEDNPKAAAQHFEKSIQLNPAFPEVYGELAMLRMRTSDYVGAAAAIEDALKLDPDNASANRDLLVLYQRLRDTRAAAQAERVAQIESRREQKASLLFRTIEIQPY